jgi:hypothetical protein
MRAKKKTSWDITFNIHLGCGVNSHNPKCILGLILVKLLIHLRWRFSVCLPDVCQYEGKKKNQLGYNCNIFVSMETEKTSTKEQS